MQGINLAAIERASKNWEASIPFNYVVIDDFLDRNLATDIAGEFFDYDDNRWHVYSNPLEVKKTCNIWNHFGPSTYKVLLNLCNDRFVQILSDWLRGCGPLVPDFGLNGGGLHLHGSGGKLNPHLDYYVHPKAGLFRKLNLIVYLNKGWRSSWGGSLGLYESSNPDAPGELSCKIVPKFNRAVIFDTVQNWHGLAEPVSCPVGIYRKSLAIYYLTETAEIASLRRRALFAPNKHQIGDKEIEDLIRKRSDVDSSSTVYQSDH